MEFPRDSLIVFTGVSGSGKSSLAFDTIFAEGRRRYVESLSVYARQFLGQLDKPDVDAVEGLSPAIAIDQKTTGRGPHCPECGEPVSRQTPQRIVDHLLEHPEGTRFQLPAPVVRDRKGEHGEVLRQLSADGFSRVRADGTVLSLTAPPALGPAGGVVGVEFVDREPGDDGRESTFSEDLACPRSHDIAVRSLEPRLFSFNAPRGACPACTGLGFRTEVDPSLVVPDDTKSLADGAIAPWTNTSGADYFTRLLEALAAETGFSTTTAWRALSAEARQAVLHGTEGEVPCAACAGARLTPGVLAVAVGGRNIAEVAALPLDELAAFTGVLELTHSERRIAEAVLAEIGERLRFLLDVGLDHLSLDRPAASLCGGEAQRVKLAAELKRRTRGRTLCLLDEPTTGLHAADVARLPAALQRLVEGGNTVVLSEHNLDVVKAADRLIDMGPEGGHRGGRVIAEGTAEQLAAHPGSHTGRYLMALRTEAT